MSSSTCRSGGWNRPTLCMVKMNWALIPPTLPTHGWADRTCVPDAEEPVAWRRVLLLHRREPAVNSGSATSSRTLCGLAGRCLPGRSLLGHLLGRCLFGGGLLGHLLGRCLLVTFLAGAFLAGAFLVTFLAGAFLAGPSGYLLGRCLLAEAFLVTFLAVPFWRGRYLLGRCLRAGAFLAGPSSQPSWLLS